MRTESWSKFVESIGPADADHPSDADRENSQLMPFFDKHPNAAVLDGASDVEAVLDAIDAQLAELGLEVVLFDHPDHLIWTVERRDHPSHSGPERSNVIPLRA